MKPYFLIIFAFVSASTFAQVDTIYNSKGTEKIPYYEQLYRFRVWRNVDFREKQNAAFKSPNSDIIKLMLDNLHTGVLKGYQPNDIYFSAEQSIEDFLIKNRQQGIAQYDAKKEYYAQEQVEYNGKVYSSTSNNNKGHAPTEAQFWAEMGETIEFFKSVDIPMVTVVEDVIFDKRRSRLYYDVLGFILINTEGNPLAIVNYKEFYNLVNKLSHARDMKTRSSVYWKNSLNPGSDRTFTDAIKLRMFHGVIEKVENPEDRTILEIFTLNHRSYAESVFARWEEDMKMLEKEHNLWEY